MVYPNNVDSWLYGSKFSESDIMSFYILDAWSIAKPHALEHLATDILGYDSDIVIITETHLDDKHDNIQLLNYLTFHADHKHHKGRGVAVFVKESYNSSILVVPSLTYPKIERLWVLVKSMANPKCIWVVRGIYYIN